jgi:hypothetical protein
MRYTLLLVAALGLIATTAPAVLAQESQPTTTPIAADQAPAPAPAPVYAGPIAAPAVATGCCQPVMQVSCCQPVMTAGCCQPAAACCQPGCYPYGAPVQTASTRRGLFRGRRTTEAPVYAGYYTPYQTTGMVYGMVQPVGYSTAACCGGTVVASQPVTGAVTGGVIASQPIPGAVTPAGGVVTPTDTPIMTAGYPMVYTTPYDTTFEPQTARRGLFGRMRR